MGKRTTQKAYEKFLARKIHRYLGSATSADFASIVVQFKFFHSGKETEYRIDRTWSGTQSHIDEQLIIKKRYSDKDEFKPLDNVEESQWQSFIDDLIPKGIVKLFFFDGEKIVGIAKEGREDLAIKESFKSLLGIEIVEQLRADLQVNLMRNLTVDSKSLQRDFDKYNAEKDEHTALTQRLEERLAQNKTRWMQYIWMQKHSRPRYLDRRRICRCKRRCKNKTGSVLPFSLIPTELANLAEQIKRDESVQQRKIEEKIIQAQIKDVDNHLKKMEFWKDFDLEKKTHKKIRQKISLLLANKQSSSAEETVFGFSIQQASRILDIIQKTNTIALKEFREETQKIIVISDDIAKMQKLVTSAPDNDEIGPLVSKLAEINKSEGELKAEMNHIEESISSNASMQRHIDVKLRNIVSQMYRDEKAKIKVDLTQNVQLVLEEFVEKLKIKKIRLLEEYLLDALHTLLHKTNFIEKVVVNPDTFEITLFRKNNDLLPKDLLSEGEKQMFATSVLWALAKTSSRPLPFMIDTPLARLDEGHRTNIVEKFLPFASHQVLLFSTDKEIEYEHYKKLEPYLMRSYAMEYLPEKDPSPPNPEEFDEQGSEIHPSVLFGEYDDIFMALMIQRLRRDGLDPEIYLNKMLRAHFNRGVIALSARINDISDFDEMIAQER
ncbi:hypothetical protein GBAR_LOCUS949 [Geodia barretti]|uniref:DNA sulfur modification protein DndD n=1 Tax=Geodia barretti TaxID=519541 RepID=A0AA35QUT8_GEOBA|nr:hypothetical protein GBAR_LOCUS949 [Geodia barretti]